MPMSESRKQYLAQYKKERLKRVPLELDLETYERLQGVIADNANGHKTMNGLLKGIIAEYLKWYDHKKEKDAAKAAAGTTAQGSSS